MNMIAVSFEKSFFPIENEFMEWEKKWLINQIQTRTNFTTKSHQLLNLMDREFLRWFLDAIRPDFQFIGTSIIDILQHKLKWAKVNDFEMTKTKEQKWKMYRYTLID